MTKTSIYAAGAIAGIAALVIGCKSEERKKKDALRAEVMALVEQTPQARQSRRCEVMVRDSLFDGADDPLRIACATWRALTPSARQVYMDSVVDEKPRMLSHPPLHYPEQLRRARIEGRTVVRIIVDATGRVEPTAIKVIESDNPAFDRPAMDMMLGARFQPGRVLGHPMRVVLDRTVEFRIPP